jgi:hypothetical protein
MDTLPNNIVEARSISSARFMIYLNTRNEEDSTVHSARYYEINDLLKSESRSDNAYFYIYGKYGNDAYIDILLGNKQRNDKSLYDENFLDEFEREDKAKDIQDLIEGKVLKVKCHFVIEINRAYKHLIADTTHHSYLVEELLKRLECKGWHDIGNHNCMFKPFCLDARYMPDNDTVIKFIPAHSTMSNPDIVGTTSMLIRLDRPTREELAKLSPEKAFRDFMKLKGRSLLTHKLPLSGAYGLHTHRDKVTIFRDFDKSPYNYVVRLIGDKTRDKDEVKEMLKTELSRIQMTLPKAAYLISHIEGRQYLVASKPGEKNSFFFKGNRIPQIEVPILANLTDLDPIIDDLTAFITAVTAVRDEAIHIKNFFKTKNQRNELIEALAKAVRENPILFADQTRGSIGEITGKAAQKLLSEVTEAEVIETDVTDN